MSIFPQLLLDVHDKLSVDLFAGGGGASLGFEMATGRQIDIAINHDEKALQMHEANHPQTLHLRSDVFEVDPRLVCQGRPVGFLWASPDCTYHSKARGKKPIRHKNQKRRALAWVVTRWAGQVRPDVIMLENVEEFSDWGPLHAKRVKHVRTIQRANGTEWDSESLRLQKNDKTLAEPGEHTPVEFQDLVPNKRKKRHSFRKWVASLVTLGYTVEWRYLRACDYGAPTIRRRLFLIARCDGKPIVWPDPSHGDPKSKEVETKQLLPWRTAAECIDWSIPMCSIFATKEEAKAFQEFYGFDDPPKRPLAPKTMQRIARGVQRYVIDNPKPYIAKVPWGKDDPYVTPLTVSVAHGEESKGGKRWGKGSRSVEDPQSTVPCSNDTGVVAPVVTPLTHAGERRSVGVDEPLATITTAHRGESAIVAPVLVRNQTGDRTQPSRDINEPAGSILAHGANAALIAPVIGGVGGRAGQSPERSVEAPLGTVTAKGDAAVFAPVIVKSNFGDKPHSGVDEPLKTIVGSGTHHSVVAPVLTQRYGERDGQLPRARSIEEPAPTVVPKGNGSTLIAAHLHTNNNSRDPLYGADEPANTIVADGARHNVVVANIATYYGMRGDRDGRASNLTDPLPTIPTENRHAVVASFLGQNNGGFAEGNTGDGKTLDEPMTTILGKGANQSVVAGFFDQANGGFDNRTGRPVEEPISTILTESRGHHGLIAANMVKLRGTSVDADADAPLHTVSAEGQHHGLVAANIQRDFGNSVGGPLDEPIGTITGSGGGKAGMVAAFMDNYYGTASGNKVDDPMHTATTRDRFGVVTVKIKGVVRIITDILMRMLQPRELYRAQGFHDGYIIDRGADGRELTKTDQVRMCGNSVCPPVACALIRANVPEMIVRTLKAKKPRKAAAMAVAA